MKTLQLFFHPSRVDAGCDVGTLQEAPSASESVTVSKTASRGRTRSWASRLWGRVAAWMPLLLLGATAPARTLYVSPSGNDANDGSSGKPFRTSQKAIRAASNGDEIRLAKGHYGGVLQSGKRLRFLAWNGNVTLGTGIPSVNAGPYQTRPIAPGAVGRDLSQVGNRTTEPGAGPSSGLDAGPSPIAGKDRFAACGNLWVLGSVNDPDRKAVVRWSVVEGPGDLRFEDASALETLAAFNGVGRYVVRLTASNGPYRVTSDMVFESYVSEKCDPGSPPPPGLVVDAGPDRTFAGVLTATLEGWAGLNPGSASPRVTWSQLEGPGRVGFNNVAQTNSVISVPQYGTYRLQLNAVSGRLSESNSVALHFVEVGGPEWVVRIPDVPPVPYPPGTASMNGIVTFRGSTDLPPGTRVEWSKVSGPGTVTFTPANRVGTQAEFKAPGEYRIRLMARYGNETRFATNRVTVYSAPVNRPPDVRNVRAPEFVDLPDTALVVGEVSDDGLPADPGQVRLEWRTLSGPAPARFSPSDRTQSSARFSQPGEYRIALWATDSQLEDSESVPISVRGGLHYLYTREDVQRRCGALGNPILVCNNHPKYRIRYTILLRRSTLWGVEFDTTLTGILAPGECREFACSDRSTGPGYSYVLHRIVAGDFVTTGLGLLGVGSEADSEALEALREGPTEALQPILSYSRAGGEWVVSWPAAVGGVLEASPSIGTAGVWEAVSEPAETQGDRRVVRVKPDGGSRFFRLRLP